MKIVSYFKWSLVAMLVVGAELSALGEVGAQGGDAISKMHKKQETVTSGRIMAPESSQMGKKNSESGGGVKTVDIAAKQDFSKLAEDVKSADKTVSTMSNEMAREKTLIDQSAKMQKKIEDVTSNMKEDLKKAQESTDNLLVEIKNINARSNGLANKDWTQKFGVPLIAVLVILGLVPAIMSCCLVLKCNKMLEGRISELRGYLEKPGDDHENDAWRKGLDTLPTVLKKAVEDCINAKLPKKTPGGEDGLGEMKIQLGVIKTGMESVVSRLGTLESSQSSVMKQVGEQRMNVEGAVRSLKSETDRLLENLKGQIGTLESRSAELAGKEKTIQMREQTLDASIKGAVAEALKNVQAEKQSLATALANIAEQGVQKRLDEQRSHIEAQKQQEVEAVVARYQQETERVVKAAVAQKESEAGQAREALKQLQDSVARQLSMKETECQNRITDKDMMLSAEKTAHEQTKSALSTTAQKLAVETANFQKTKTELVDLQVQNEELSKRLYPAELLANPNFAELQAQLDRWSANGYAGAGITRSALGMFAARRSVAEGSWTLALRDISFGVSLALREAGVDAVSAAAELSKWSQFMNGFSDASQDSPFYFQLSVPRVGAMVDSSWMKQISATKIGMVNSWAVYTAMGLRYQADIA